MVPIPHFPVALVLYIHSSWGFPGGSVLPWALVLDLAMCLALGHRQWLEEACSVGLEFLSLCITVRDVCSGGPLPLRIRHGARADPANLQMGEWEINTFGCISTEIL